MKRGFTLVEMLVSVALFSMVMVVAIGALLSLSVATRRAEAINSTVNNLDSAVDSMSRTIRTGFNYDCGINNNSVPTHDCTSGDTFLELQAADGSFVAYCYDPGTFTLYRKTLSASSPNGSPLFVSCTNGGNGFLALTAPEVKITSFAFYVSGTCPAFPVGNPCTPDTQQPLVTMVIAGKIDITSTQSSQFNIQTTVTQRLEDL